LLQLPAFSFNRRDRRSSFFFVTSEGEVTHPENNNCK
jgi:hypothetical protein